jgi:phosphatidylinositol alpha-1,6-mannosyltransferase
VHVFPVLESSDDVEGFGMVAIEAAANGLPTVAFDVGGIADAVEDPVSGRLVPAQDYVKLTNAVSAYITNGRLAEFEEQCCQSARKRSWGEFNASIQVALLR